MNRVTSGLATGLSVLALAAAGLGIGLAWHNGELRRDIAVQQQYVQQSVQLDGLYREMARALAELSARNGGDEALRSLLQRHGIGFQAAPPAASPPTARK